MQTDFKMVLALLRLHTVYSVQVMKLTAIGIISGGRPSILSQEIFACGVSGRRPPCYKLGPTRLHA